MIVHCSLCFVLRKESLRTLFLTTNGSTRSTRCARNDDFLRIRHIAFCRHKVSGDTGYVYLRGRLKNKEHRRNHAQARPERSLKNAKACDALCRRIYAGEHRGVQKVAQSYGGSHINESHRAFPTFLDSTNSRFSLETSENSVFQISLAGFFPGRYL